MASSPTSYPSSSRGLCSSPFSRSLPTCSSPVSSDGCGEKRSRRSVEQIDEDAEDEDGDPAPQQKGEDGVSPSGIRHHPIKIGRPKHTHCVAPSHYLEIQFSRGSPQMSNEIGIEAAGRR